jgi:hypothetical protein
MVGREGVDCRGRGGGKGQTRNRKEQSLTAGKGEGSSLHNRRAPQSHVKIIFNLSYSTLKKNSIFYSKKIQLFKKFIEIALKF